MSIFGLDRVAFTILPVLLSVALLMISVVIHEVSHGWVAYKLGDPTAKRAGRLTLNPIKHIDPFGSLILPLMLSITSGAAFGWAKPVPYNPGNFKDIRKGEFLVGLSGPASNLLQALVGALLARGLWHAIKADMLPLALGGDLAWFIFFALSLYVRINLVLMFFNLIPIPPLDGASIIAPFLSDEALEKYYSLQRYFMPILFILFILVPYVSPISPVSIYLQHTALPLYDLMMRM